MEYDRNPIPVFLAGEDGKGAGPVFAIQLGDEVAVCCTCLLIWDRQLGLSRSSLRSGSGVREIWRVCVLLLSHRDLDECIPGDVGEVAYMMAYCQA